MNKQKKKYKVIYVINEEHYFNGLEEQAVFSFLRFNGINPSEEFI